MSDEPKEIIIPLEPSPEMQRAVEFAQQMQAEYERLFLLSEPQALFERRSVTTGEQILMAIAATHQHPLSRCRETDRQDFIKWREGEDYRPQVFDN